MTRVVQLISGLMYGGGQKVVLDLLDGFAGSREVDAELWLLGCRHNVMRARATFVAPYDGDYASPATLLRTAARIRAQLAASPATIVHSHGWDADMIAFLATRGRPTGRVVHLHVTPAWISSKRPQHRVRRMLSKLMLSGADLQVLTVAAAVRDHWASAFPDLATRARVVHNSVDPIGFHPVGRSERAQVVTFGAACRLTPQKGLRVLLEALPTGIEQSRTPIRLKVAGEGPERPGLERLVRDLGLTEHVEFCGHVGDVAEFYRRLDVLVLAAISDEGLPLAILEAMATGVPVITTDIGGASEAVRHGVDGLVIPPNASSRLAEAMSQLANDAPGRIKMGQSSFERARSTFSPCAQLSAVAMSYAALVEACLPVTSTHGRTH